MFNDEFISSLLIPIIIFAVLGLGVLWLIGRSGQPFAEHPFTNQPQTADATVIQIGEAETDTATGKVTVALKLGIFPTDGEAYEAAVMWRVSAAQLPQVQVGQSIPIKIDAVNPRVIFPAVPWAEYIHT